MGITLTRKQKHFILNVLIVMLLETFEELPRRYSKKYINATKINLTVKVLHDNIFNLIQQIKNFQNLHCLGNWVKIINSS